MPCRRNFDNKNIHLCCIRSFLFEPVASSTHFALVGDCACECRGFFLGVM